MHELDIDLETYSSNDLSKCSIYKYAEADDFEILLFGYSADGSDVRVIDLASGESIPDEINDALTNDEVIKWAHNSQFERICLSRYLRDKGISLDPFHDNHPLSTECARYLNPESWRCSMIWGTYLGLPLSLDKVGSVLKLEQRKMSEGKALIRYFCVPCKPTKANGERTRNFPANDPERWAVFKAYNKRDVEVELQIKDRLQKFSVPDFVWDEYHIDQEINDRGILIDMDLVENAIAMDDRSNQELSDKMKDLTHLDNPGSVQQMKQWLADNGMEMESLGKKEVAATIKTAPPDLVDVLSLRQQLAKSSVKKYQAMKTAICKDGRAHGMFQFYGANSSGRWAGRIIQLQNLPQNHMPDLEQARDLVKAGDYEMVSLLYDDVPDTLSQLIRTAFIPKPGYKFIVSDFSAIEARVLSYLAHEKWRMDVFNHNGDIYCASASAMFGVPVEKHGQNARLRQKGKIAELALGYGGSIGALKAMGALDMGLSEDELYPLVASWRSANPNIVQFWWDVDSCVTDTVEKHIQTETHGIIFSYRSGMMFITPPSGRQLSYVKPRMEYNRFGSESVTYEGVGQNKKWERIESYGPKFVENIVQAISRDILAYAMKTFRCCEIVGHVHDELILIIECDPRVSLEAVCEQMGRTPPWLPGFKLNADGYECRFYMKS